MRIASVLHFQERPSVSLKAVNLCNERETRLDIVPINRDSLVGSRQELLGRFWSRQFSNRHRTHKPVISFIRLTRRSGSNDVNRVGGCIDIAAGVGFPA